MGGCVSHPVQLYCTVDFTPLGPCHGEYQARGGMRPGAEVINQSQQQHHEHHQSQQHEATPAAQAAPTSTPASPTRQNVAATATTQMPAAREVPVHYKAPPPGLACSTNSTSTSTPPPAGDPTPQAQAHHHHHQLEIQQAQAHTTNSTSTSAPPYCKGPPVNWNGAYQSCAPDPPCGTAQAQETQQQQLGEATLLQPPLPAGDPPQVTATKPAGDPPPTHCKPPPAGFPSNATWKWNGGYKSCAGGFAACSAPPQPDPPLGAPPGVASSTHAAQDLHLQQQQLGEAPATHAAQEAAPSALLCQPRTRGVEQHF